MSQPKHPVRSVNRALDIVEVVQELDGAGVSEIAARVDVGKSAVHNHLNTLVNREYLLKEGDQYHIGISFFGLGAYARNRMDIYASARSEADKLADNTDELVNLLVEKNGKGVYLYQASGENAVDLDTYEGKQVYLHCTALGKALLAFRPHGEVVDVLDTHGMPKMTESTITDREEFFEELERIREQKFALDCEERLTGLCCVAAPITDEQDRSIGAISISCPLHRVSDQRFREELPDEVLSTANVIELSHNYS
ncbi:IclR family transcriptional regulator [Halegenticoccus tardaugens]|uniref:IclR family transcriptional regulator n=1 Tax=Halegenticoccus tardaugens TaxID=2071624 RepID=UPI00100A5DF0|nr:IclR family transcriptional regulator [Halegenticoccus tardaugens]